MKVAIFYLCYIIVVVLCAQDQKMAVAILLRKCTSVKMEVDVYNML